MQRDHSRLYCLLAARVNSRILFNSHSHTHILCNNNYNNNYNNKHCIVDLIIFSNYDNVINFMTAKVFLGRSFFRLKYFFSMELTLIKPNYDIACENSFCLFNEFELVVPFKKFILIFYWRLNIHSHNSIYTDLYQFFMFNIQFKKIMILLHLELSMRRFTLLTIHFKPFLDSIFS